MKIIRKNTLDRPEVYAVFNKETMQICKQADDPHGRAFGNYDDARKWAESRAARNPGQTYVILHVWSEITAVVVKPTIETTIYND